MGVRFGRSASAVGRPTGTGQFMIDQETELDLCYDYNFIILIIRPVCCRAYVLTSGGLVGNISMDCKLWTNCGRT